MSAWLPITRESVMCVKAASLSVRISVPYCRAPEAVVHRFARRFLMFKLPDQLTLCFTKSTGEVRVLGYRNQRRKTGQARAQDDALFLAAAVAQGDIDIHVTRIPPPQMRREGRQRLQHVRTFLRHETRAYMDRVFAKGVSLLVIRLAHRGLVSGALGAAR